MASADDCKETAIRAEVTPLTQELALGVEDDDAVVAVAVGDIDMPGSIAMSAGSLRSSGLLLAPGSPHFSSALSQTPLRPIWRSSCLPSCDHFCTIPSALPPIQMLSWPSTKQPGTDLGICFGSPHAFTMFPSESYSMTTGAGSLPTVCSIAVRSDRFTPKT
jgi:hypothetical protein